MLLSGFVSLLTCWDTSSPVLPCCCVSSCPAVLVLKVVICPLAALGLVKLLTHVQAPFAEKLPVAPLASIIEMGLKFASRAS